MSLFQPLEFLGKQVVFQMLSNMKQGCLHYYDEEGKLKVFGETCEKFVTIRILKGRFYQRILLNGDIGFAEAYIEKEVETEDLTEFLKLLIINRDNLSNLTISSSYLGNFVSLLKHFQLANTLQNSRLNISAHYDIGNELFTRFLDSSMLYSSAVWSKPGQTLTEAQYHKLDMIMKKAQLSEQDLVLEIGTGWGTFCVEAVKKYNCQVYSVTLSKEQLEFAQARIQKELTPEQQEKIILLLADYRLLPEMFKGKYFDKIVSIEMIEAVGPEFLSSYFYICHQLLHPKSGIMVFQCITMPENRYDAYKKNVDFIQKYIFPGGHCPSVTALVNAIFEGSQKQLIVDHLENIGPHYAPTLKLWRDQFIERFDELKNYPKYIKNSSRNDLYWPSFLNSDQPKREKFYSETFYRKWLYYFSYCEAGFATRTLGNVQMVLTREADLKFQTENI